MKELIILVADDDAEDRFILKDSFDDINKAELRIDFAEDGVEVMEYLMQALQGNNLPRLLILDLNMPRMNGKETLVQIKSDSRLSPIDVVIFSTSGIDSVRQECIELGAREYLIKPTSYQDSVRLANYFFELAAAAPVQS